MASKRAPVKSKPKRERFVWPRAGICDKDIRRSTIVQIDWSDATGQHGWRPAKDDLGLTTVTSVGFLLHVKTTHITIGQGITNNNETQALESIPRGWVHRVRVLQRAPK